MPYAPWGADAVAFFWTGPDFSMLMPYYATYYNEALDKVKYKVSLIVLKIARLQGKQAL